MKIFYKIFLFSVFCFLFSVLAVSAATPQELKESIGQKTQELQKINAQIQEAQKSLEETKEKGATLKKEVDKINTQINQINLSVRASEILIEKTGLEIDSAQNDIVEIGEKIDIQKRGVSELLKELQQKSSETPLVIFLKNKSLAESVFEVQGLTDLSGNLSNKIAEMRTLKTRLGEKINELSNKKLDKEEENFNLKNKKIITEDIKKDKQSLLTTTKNQEKVYQQTLSDLEKKQSAISDEIEFTEDELRRSFDPALLPLKRPGILAWPVLNPRITQKFGEISRLYRGKPHNGMDFGTPIGTAIFSADDGEITAIGNNGRYQYGKYVLIKHNNNLATLYAHLSYNSLLKKGDLVKKGQLIGYSGNTGYAIGRGHLHLGLYWEPSIRLQNLPNCNCGLVPIGVTIDPLDYLPGGLAAR